MLKVFYSEWLALFRRRSELANPLMFFLLVVTLFPLAISPDSEILTILAPGVLWVAALLAALLSLDLMFKQDFDEGALEQCMLSGRPLYFIVLMKALVHWLLTGLPLVLMSPIMGLLLFLPSQAYLVLLASLLLGTISMSLIGAMGAALTVAIQRGGILVSLLILPLMSPPLIFGSSAVSAAGNSLPYQGQLLWLGVLTVLSITFAPIAAAVALKISIEAD